MSLATTTESEFFFYFRSNWGSRSALSLPLPPFLSISGLIWPHLSNQWLVAHVVLQTNAINLINQICQFKLASGAVKKNRTSPHFNLKLRLLLGLHLEEALVTNMTGDLFWAFKVQSPTRFPGIKSNPSQNISFSVKQKSTIVMLSDLFLPSWKSWFPIPTLPLLIRNIDHTLF